MREQPGMKHEWKLHWRALIQRPWREKRTQKKSGLRRGVIRLKGRWVKPMLAIRQPQKAPLRWTNPLRKHLKGIRQSAKTGPKRDPEWIELRNNRSIPSWIVKAERKEKGSKKSTRSITEN